MINNTVLVGRLTRDADLKYTGSGTAVANFSLAVERTFKNAQGEKETDYVNVVAWEKKAKLISEYTRKGSLIGVTGRIQTRNYQNNEGKKVYITEVVAENVQFLEPKGNGSKQAAKKPYEAKKKMPNFDEDPFEDNSDSIDDSDLPFD